MSQSNPNSLEVHFVEVDVIYVEKHIDDLLDVLASSKRMKDRSFVKSFSDFLIGLGIPISNMDKMFDLDVSTKDLAYFYWIYKRNCDDWLDIDNFKCYIRILPEIFSPITTFPMACTDINKMKISLGILFYLDRMAHN